MSHSTILIPFGSTRESFRSSPSLVILSDTKAEADPSEAPPSLDYVPSSPIHAPTSPYYHPRLDTESDPLEDDSEPIKDVPKAAKPLSTQRCRSPTTLRPAATSAPVILSSVPADRLPPRKRIEEIEEELQTLRARVVSSERENTSLRARIRVAELSDDSTRVMLQTARTILT
nr:hypothetical protein [Tanacetum cinerariifolium]